MNKVFAKLFIGVVMLASYASEAMAAPADTLKYEPATVRHAGPFVVKSPVVLDSINVMQQKYSADRLFDTPLSLSATDKAAAQSLADISFEPKSLNLITFDVVAKAYVMPSIKMTGAKKNRVYVDGNAINGRMHLQPGAHTIAVKFIPDTTKVGVSIMGLPSVSDQCALAAGGEKTAFSMTTNLGTRNISSASLSPSGRWSIVSYSWYDSKNKNCYETLLVDTKTKQSSILDKRVSWMPRSDKYYFIEKNDGKTTIKTVDPATGAVTVFASDVPSDNFYISPTEDFLILSNREEGPRKENGVFQIVHPDDRQPGWRSRSSLSRYDIKTGFVQPLTYTYHNVWLSDISQDGKRILFVTSSDSLTQRPTTLHSLYELDLETLAIKTIYEKDGFVSGGDYVGDGKIIFSASTEAFHGIGKRVPEGRTPNMYDYHLYLLDMNQPASYEGVAGKVIPLTADDKTSIEKINYSPADGNVYYSAQNGDSVSLYRLDMKTLKSVRINQPIEVLTGISVASKSGDISVWGGSACVPPMVCVYPASYIRKATATSKVAGGNWAANVICNPNKQFFENVALGTVHPWKFTCKRGYEVTGHYYLPADFDPAKKYPVIVHYYGGCSPTSRRFGGGSHYPAHYWNALGYITFIVNPSGASGFGQEWASRHVNTMGEGVAEDIIEAVEQFAQDVPQVNKDKIGCVSASYGGFMTQCMLTKTDLFACGISHAGISDHTSYWGEGYWGYSYSEVSAANSYPWTRKDLFVDRSPLYNANKIHKPLLFTHGTADTNVPIGESIQMYTALKLLGVPTAFIMVEGENHGIMDPVKRTKWIDSMMAWFQKYLQDNDSWWKAIYSEKEF